MTEQLEPNYILVIFTRTLPWAADISPGKP